MNYEDHIKVLNFMHEVLRKYSHATYTDSLIRLLEVGKEFHFDEVNGFKTKSSCVRFIKELKALKYIKPNKAKGDGHYVKVANTTSASLDFVFQTFNGLANLNQRFFLMLLTVGLSALDVGRKKHWHTMRELSVLPYISENGKNLTLYRTNPTFAKLVKTSTPSGGLMKTHSLNPWIMYLTKEGEEFVRHVRNLQVTLQG